MSIVIGVSGFLFFVAGNLLDGGPIMVLLLLARVLPRQSRWPVVALATLVAFEAIGTLLSIGTILVDAYG